MSSKIIMTCYEIRKVSEDGLVKLPQTCDYRGERSLFYGPYFTVEEIENAILERGELYTDYVVLTVKRVVTA